MECFTIGSRKMNKIDTHCKSFYLYNESGSVAHVICPFSCYELQPYELRLVCEASMQPGIDEVATNTAFYTECDLGESDVMQLLFFEKHTVVVGVCTLDITNYAVPTTPTPKEFVDITNYTHETIIITFPEYDVVNCRMNYNKVILQAGTNIIISTKIPMRYGAFKDYLEVTSYDCVDSTDYIVRNSSKSSTVIKAFDKEFMLDGQTYAVVSTGGSYV